MNTIKTVGLMTFLVVLFVAIGGALGGQGGMLMAIVMATIMNVGMYWFSDKIVLRMYKAQPVTEAEAPELYAIVHILVQKAGMPMPTVYIIPDETPNAFATGRNPEHAVVAVTQGIMRILSRDELAGVIAHELAHIKHRDMLTGTIVATFAGAISMLAQMAQWSMIFGGGRRDNDDEGGGSPIVAIVMMIVAPIAAMLVQMAISRSREFEADKGGAVIAGSPSGLSNALLKLEKGTQMIPMTDAKPATAHMFIVNPLTGGGLMKLFSTHPPIEERVQRLNDLARGRA